jgi:hypothetical protein
MEFSLLFMPVLTLVFIFIVAHGPLPLLWIPASHQIKANNTKQSNKKDNGFHYKLKARTVPETELNYTNRTARGVCSGEESNSTYENSRQICRFNRAQCPGSHRVLKEKLHKLEIH